MYICNSKFNIWNIDDLKKDTHNETTHVLEIIKVGREEYQVKKGDYIIFNGALYQFCSGDGRTLKLKNYTRYTNLVLSATMVKKIPFDLMIKQNYKSFGIDMVRWFF